MRIALSWIVAFLTTLSISVAAQPAELSGRVTSLASGQGIDQAMVTITFAEGTSGPRAISTFTNGAGEFRLSDKSLSRLPSVTLEVKKLGFKQVQSKIGALKSVSGEAGAVSEKFTVTLYVEPQADIGSQVPASAWLAAAPSGDARNTTLASCSSCHQMPSPRVREFAAKIEAASGGPDGSKKALEEWRKLVRHESWRFAIKYMRSKHYAIFPLESGMNLDAVDWPTAQNEDYNLFNGRQGEVIAKYLADHFPRSTASLPREAYSYGAPLATNERTVNG